MYPKASDAQRTILLIATLSSFLIPFMGSSINIALPTIGNEFSIDAIMLSWVSTAYLLTAAMLLVPMGKLSDIYGRKRFFASGILVYTMASLLSVIAPSTFVFILSRVLQGVGGAMLAGTGAAILTTVFPVGERGKALGINSAATYLGLSLGPFLGGFMTQHLGWRSIFIANAIVGLAIFLIILWKLRHEEWAEAKGERFDFAGSVIYSLTLIALMYGFSLLPALTGGALIIIGVLGMLLFIMREINSPNPLLDIKLFRYNSVFAFSNLAALINYSATYAVGFLLSLYLQYIKGLSPQGAGLILVAQPIMMTVFSPLAGWLSDKIEPRIVASIGMGLAVLGLGFFIWLTAQTNLAIIIASLVILGLGFALFSAPNTNAVMSSVEKRFYGVASGTLGTMRLTGQMLSMGIAMLIFALYIGKVKITPEYYALFLRGTRTAFTIFALLCLLGVFASLARGRVRKGVNPEIR